MMIYMDNAATTRIRREVFQAMISIETSEYGNPSANYEFARKAKKLIEDARITLANTIGCEPEEIYYTSGGTEADNWALKSIMLNSLALSNKRGHIITSSIEHHAVINSCHFLEKMGFRVSYIGVDREGVIKMDELEAAIRPDTLLISVMAANNEIGTIEPFQEIGKLARKHNILFHTDAVQAYSSIPIDVNNDNIDMLSISAHKINGPKGIGFLYIRSDIDMVPFMDGGAQERNMRAGTENVSGIIGMAKSAEIAFSNRHMRIEKELSIRDYMIQRVLREIPYSSLNGHKTDRLPNNMNFTFENVDGGTLIAMLDHQNICASAGSACSSSSKAPSHVLKAIGLSDEMARSSIRLTINEQITRREADYVLDCLKYDVRKLQSMV